MQQYYIEEELKDKLILKNELYHYLYNVIKIKENEVIYLANGKQKAKYKILAINNKLNTENNISAIKVGPIIEKKTEIKVDLAIGLLKKNNLELVIQKTTELGINKITLLNLQNNIVKFEPQKLTTKLKRYTDIIQNATNQCKRIDQPEISYLDDINELKKMDYDKIFIMYEKQNNNEHFLKNLKNTHKNEKILIIIGPEGGFSLAEIEYFEENNYIFSSLGENILRAETAAITAVGLCVNYLSIKEKNESSI